MKKLVVSLVSLVALVGALVAPFSVAEAKGKKAAGPVVLGTDDPADWGTNVDPGVAPAGDVLGQELIEASMAMADATTVNFIIKVKSLPPSGGMPEFTRYGWEFMVDGHPFQLTGGFTEYIRGVCNPNVTNSCPPPRDPGAAPFFIRTGPCNVGAACTEEGLVHATFDAATATITIPVPLEMIDAKPGSKIGPGASASFSGTVYSAPQANISQANLPYDGMMLLKTFVVPKGK